MMTIRIRHASDSMGHVNIEIEGLDGTYTVYANRRNSSTRNSSRSTIYRSGDDGCGI